MCLNEQKRFTFLNVELVYRTIIEPILWSQENDSLDSLEVFLSDWLMLVLHVKCIYIHIINLHCRLIVEKETTLSSSFTFHSGECEGV